VIKLLVFLLCISFSGVLYRMGGSAKWNTKWRDLGCPLVLLVIILTLFGLKLDFWWAYLLTFLLSFGALTTYYDWLFGYDNYYAHGLGCGLAGISLVWADVPLWIILARLTLCTIGMGLWSKYTKNDVVEEIGRGVFFIL